MHSNFDATNVPK
uniref:Uncharacterized protein n=1 Tax=Arundo donax TaxID=35708 RepID=A0A0A9BYC2_ARUDO